MIKAISVDGEQIDIDDMSNDMLTRVIKEVDAELTAVSLSTGEPYGYGIRLSDTERYRQLRLRQLSDKRKALLLQARIRKLEID